MKKLQFQVKCLGGALVIVLIVAIIGWFKPDSSPKYRKGQFLVSAYQSGTEVLQVQEDCYGDDTPLTLDGTLEFVPREFGGPTRQYLFSDESVLQINK